MRLNITRRNVICIEDFRKTNEYLRVMGMLDLCPYEQDM